MINTQLGEGARKQTLIGFLGKENKSEQPFHRINNFHLGCSLRGKSRSIVHNCEKLKRASALSNKGSG